MRWCTSCFGRRVERDVDLAVRHAADLARARGRSLASITLRGAGLASAVEGFARAALGRLGVSCGEVRLEVDTGAVRLESIELDH